MSFFSRKPPESPADEPQEQPPMPVANPLDGFGLTFDTDNLQAVYNSLADDGKEFTLFNTLLPKPVNETSLKVSRHGGKLALYGVVSLAEEAEANAVVESVKAYFTPNQNPGELDERGGALVLPGEAGTKTVLSKGRRYSEGKEIHISTGRLKTGYSDYAEVLLEPADTAETFKRATADVLGTMALTLAFAYQHAEKSLPEQTITLAQKKPDPTYNYASIQGPSEKTKPEDISDKFGVEYPKISFEDIGGQAKAKEEIKTLAFAIVNPELYQKWGTSPAKGILLHGPPGTGKTLLAKALASEAEAAFYAISPSDISSKWYGEAEQHVKEIFDEAAEQERAIIYFDELDAIIPDRDGGAHEATRRVISVMLQSMDGMYDKDNVMVVASTNRLDAIDAAMRRPGRFDRLVAVELPGEQDRKEIFAIHMQLAEQRAKRELFKNISTHELGNLTDGQSGADISEIIRRTLEMKVRTEGVLGLEPELVDQQDILAEITAYERRTEA